MVNATHNALRELGRRVSSGSDERESAVLLKRVSKCTDFSHTVCLSLERLPYSWCRAAVQNDAHSRRGWSDFPALTFPRTRVTRSSARRVLISPSPPPPRPRVSLAKSRRDAIVVKGRSRGAWYLIALNSLRSPEQNQRNFLTPRVHWGSK